MNRLFAVFFLCLIAIGVVACKSEATQVSNEFQHTVYLANSDNNGLIAVEVNLAGNSLESQVENIIKILKNGSQAGKSSISATVNVVSVKIDEKNVVINFDETYTKMTSVEEILCRSSIVKSITALAGIDSVEFYIGSIPYQNSNGTVLGAMGPDDVVLDFSGKEDKEVTKQKVLYFADKESKLLVPVEYEIPRNVDEQIEKTILNLLIKGPTDENLVSLIPVETKVKNVYTSDGVCYVDLSEDFITKHMGGSSAEMLTIYSIVNTLTELDNINKVQFLIEGTKRPEFKGHIDFDVLFQRNFDLIKSK